MLPPVDDGQNALSGATGTDLPGAAADPPSAGDDGVTDRVTDTGDGGRPAPGETGAVASAGCTWPDEAVPEADHLGHPDETAESRPDEEDVDDFWSAVLRDETERDWLDGPDRPRRLEETRTYGRPGGLAEADRDGQASLAQAVNGRFPDPRGTWIRLVNAEGPTEDAFRSNNAVDCALSVMSTWHGEPVVAARRHPEYDPSGRPLLTGETGGSRGPRSGSVTASSMWATAAGRTWPSPSG